MEQIKNLIVDDEEKQVEDISKYMLSVASTNALITYLLDTQKNNLDQNS